MVKLIIPDKKKKGEIESNVPISIMKYIYIYIIIMINWLVIFLI